MAPRIAFIGFGEAGQAMAAGLRDEGVADISAYDILFPQDSGAPLREAATGVGVKIAANAADAVRDSEIVIAAVTAESSEDAARSVAGHMQRDAFYLDVNSVSPGRKQGNAALIGAGANYLDVAIVAAIHPARHKSPMLLAGPHAPEAGKLLSTLGMNTQIVGDDIGAAAAIKMIRSVMIKGIEALTAECFIAATRAGVVQAVASSLRNNYPGVDWDKMSEYNVERMVSHGIRRAAEMREVAATLRELGVAPRMTEGTIARQQALGECGRAPELKAAIAEGREALLAAVSDAAGRES